MKKTIAIVLLTLAAGAAQANSYAYEETKRDTCSDMGRYAAKVWYQAKNGGPLPRVSEAPREKLGAFRPLFAFADKEMVERTSDYETPERAYRAGWANCMDKIDDLIRDAKYGVYH